MAKQFTRKEVKVHNNKESAWVVVHNIVYDITKYLYDHPGGDDILLEQVGGDASEAFEYVGHSMDARKLMVKFRIGEVPREERIPVQAKNTNWISRWEQLSSKKNSLVSWLYPFAIGTVAVLVCFLHF